MSLDMHCAEKDQQAILSFVGRIDHANSDTFASLIEPYLFRCKTDGIAVIIDLAEVNYISSAGLRSLMVATRRARAQGGMIGVAALQPVVQEVFAVSKFHLVLPCFTDVDAARATLCPTPSK